MRRTASMTGSAPVAPAGQPARDDLTARIFRALYTQFDLHTAGGTHIAVPKGTRASPHLAWARLPSPPLPPAPQPHPGQPRHQVELRRPHIPERGRAVLAAA